MYGSIWTMAYEPPSIGTPSTQRSLKIGDKKINNIFTMRLVMLEPILTCQHTRC
jgi:hypothetical protein